MVSSDGESGGVTPPNDKANRAAAKSVETGKTARPAAPVERLVGAVLTGNDPQPSPK